MAHICLHKVQLHLLLTEMVLRSTVCEANWHMGKLGKGIEHIQANCVKRLGTQPNVWLSIHWASVLFLLCLLS